MSTDKYKLFREVNVQVVNGIGEPNEINYDGENDEQKHGSYGGTGR